ncbi:VIN3-like protein 2 [Apostasia shenzhenica]|uniref:VIN3-like protein 2 n=1 Tax=Apostasia shenzhenica TaxID=1088818 RepID=A0A2I0A1N2_9ASPA|nr:VIN3-like protein 2 [Apostasia shenzhenica]
MGKERKYTGLSKQKLIENLFRIVSGKKSTEQSEYKGSTKPPLPTDSQFLIKRQRKNDHPSRLPVAANSLSASDESDVAKNTRFCVNVACRASLGLEDPFCRRCSCCICRKYDDNKDPSLWLFCSSENLSEGDSCGLSCHLECAMKDERTGIAANNRCSQLDGSYYCVHCGRINDLLGCWRKQLIVVKEARRVDALCYRVSLSHKLLSRSTKYHKLHQIVDQAMKKLEGEVGPLDCLPNLGRGIVNRLSVGAEVQRLCVRAIEELSLMQSSNAPGCQLQQSRFLSSSFIQLEDISSSSVTLVLGLEDEELVGYTLWTRTVDSIDYPVEPIGRLYKPNGRFQVTGLIPATKYIFKVLAFSDSRELGEWEIRVSTKSPNKDVMSSAVEGTSPKTNSSGLSNPSSEGDESHNTGTYAEKVDAMESEKSSDQLPNTLEEMPGLSGSGLDEEPTYLNNTGSHRGSTNSGDQNLIFSAPKLENESNVAAGKEMIIAPSPPITPSSLGTLLLENGTAKPERKPESSTKRSRGKCAAIICKQDGSAVEGDYEYCVKVIRWLECEGYIESNFRVKFLTWFSLSASPQERKVVSVFVDTLIDDPGSLAGQLVDSFSDAIYGKRPPPVPTGFCMRLWH